MIDSHYQFDDLLVIQRIILKSAQSSLIPYFTRSSADYKSDGSIVTEADLAMQQSLTTALHIRYPKILMLGEELSEKQQLEVMNAGEDYWCLDPLDGTNNYHHTLPIFSVSLALISAGEIILAIVYDPMREEFFSALKGQGLWINGQKVNQPVQPESMNQSIAFVDFKRLNMGIKLRLIERAPYKSQRNFGSCALEWAWLAAGRTQLLLHGSEKFWDYAAGYLLSTEAGGQNETIDGGPIFNQSLTPRSVIAASNPSLFQLWAGWIRES
ncbi:MAG: inositol monophosphatase family protein [Proteobacteria bacterium]|nr:inositol monophosphatase family protein [Pseudomonadota bacterium]